MYRGKRTCKILKEIRQEIARANDIALVTSECRYQGDCAGTCPKCEAEVAYLEQQLNLRRMAGKTVMLGGIAAGMLTLSGCKGGETTTPTATNNGTETTTTTTCSTETETGTGIWASILGIESQVNPNEGRGQLQGEVGPGFDPDPAGNGEGEGELEGDVYIEPQPLEGEVPYTPEDTVG